MWWHSWVVTAACTSTCLWPLAIGKFESSVGPGCRRCQCPCGYGCVIIHTYIHTHKACLTCRRGISAAHGCVAPCSMTWQNQPFMHFQVQQSERWVGIGSTALILQLSTASTVWWIAAIVGSNQQFRIPAAGRVVSSPCNATGYCSLVNNQI